MRQKTNSNGRGRRLEIEKNELRKSKMKCVYPKPASNYTISLYLHYVLHAMRSAKARRIVDVQNLINYFIKIVFYWHSNLDFGNLRLYLALSPCIHTIYIPGYIQSIYIYIYLCAIKLSVYIQFCLSLSL